MHVLGMRRGHPGPGVSPPGPGTAPTWSKLVSDKVTDSLKHSRSSKTQCAVASDSYKKKIL